MIYTPNFLPCIAYFTEIINNKTIILNEDDIYVKQTYRNRASILGANKLENLIIPVHASSTKTKNQDVKIDPSEAWQRKQFRTIEAAYKKSPFYQYYDYLFLPLFEKKYTYLLDIQIDSLNICLTAMQLSLKIEFKKKADEDDLIDFRPKGNYEKSKFIPYKQNFGNEFVSNLSIIDLLFCRGPETNQLLINQATNEH